VKINDILTEAHDEDIHSWVAMITGVDVGQMSTDVDEVFNKHKLNPTTSIKQLEEILKTVHATFDDDRYWHEAAKFGEVKQQQLADELIALETKIEGYLKQISTPSVELK